MLFLKASTQPKNVASEERGARTLLSAGSLSQRISLLPRSNSQPDPPQATATHAPSPPNRRATCSSRRQEALTSRAVAHRDRIQHPRHHRFRVLRGRKTSALAQQLGASQGPPKKTRKCLRKHSQLFDKRAAPATFLARRRKAAEQRNQAPVAQRIRASDYGSEGFRFES